MLLRGAQLPEPVLNRSDKETLKGKTSHSGRSFGGAPLADDSYRPNYRNGGRREAPINYGPGSYHEAPNRPPFYPPNGRDMRNGFSGVPPPPPAWIPPPPGHPGFGMGDPPPRHPTQQGGGSWAQGHGSASSSYPSYPDRRGAPTAPPPGPYSGHPIAPPPGYGDRAYRPYGSQGGRRDYR